MKATAEVKNLKTDKGKHIIIRNLHRILDIRILDIDVENGSILFLCATPFALQQVKRELFRIGYPIQSCKYQQPQDSKGYGSGRISELASV
jgi:hypothetical protein